MVIKMDVKKVVESGLYNNGLTIIIDEACNMVDRGIADTRSAYHNHDSGGAGTLEKIDAAIGAAPAGIGASVVKMASGLLHAAAHPIDAVESIVDMAARIPHAIEHPIDTIENMLRESAHDGFIHAIDMLGDGRTAEGTFLLTKSLTDIGALLFGAKAAVTSAANVANVVNKGVQLAGREITAAANAVNAGIAGNSGAMAMAGGGLFTDGAAAVRVTASAKPALMSVPPPLMSAANSVVNIADAANKHPVQPAPDKNAPTSANKIYDFKGRIGMTLGDTANYIVKKLGCGNAMDMMDRLMDWAGDNNSAFKIIDTTVRDQITLEVSSTGRRITVKKWEFDLGVGKKKQTIEITDAGKPTFERAQELEKRAKAAKRPPFLPKK